MTDKTNAPWLTTLIAPDATIRDVIKSLDDSGLKIALVSGPGRALLGTVSDGDVRRALLKNLGLDASVMEIMKSSPLVVPASMGRDNVINLMRINKINQLPIVNEENAVIGIHLWDEILEPVRRDNPMVIMAGGFGKRLRPYTDNCPKPMLLVAGKPMLELILLRAIDNGFSKFIISLFYMPEVIKDYFKDGAKWNVEISYVLEESPLGTAGALSLIQPRPELPFIVTNGDVLTDINYGEVLDFHIAHHAIATMAVRQYEWQHPFGVVKTEGIRIVEIEEKPVQRSYVNAGIYALDPAALDDLEHGSVCNMTDLFDTLGRRSAQTIAYPMHEPWVDVGRVEDFHKVNHPSLSTN